MKPVSRLNRDAAQARRTRRTKDDFLRWLRERDARQKQVTETEITRADQALAKALMVWADDGGTTA